MQERNCSCKFVFRFFWCGPIVVINARIDITFGIMFFSYLLCRIGALAKYRCERGYKIIGEPLVTCEENGLWSGQVPECVC